MVFKVIAIAGALEEISLANNILKKCITLGSKSMEI